MNLNLSATTNKYYLSESDVLHKVYTHSYVASVDAFMSCNLTVLCFFFIVPLFFMDLFGPDL